MCNILLWFSSIRVKKPKEDIPMKKMIALFLAMLLCLLCACNEAVAQPERTPTEPEPLYHVAFIPAWEAMPELFEACAAFCKDVKLPFTNYIPTEDSTAERIAAMEKAITDGNDVLILMGYEFAGAIIETIDQHPDVKYIALDVSEFDLQDAAGHADDFGYVYPKNLWCVNYQEEIEGFLAGYAAVRMGYENLGIAAGMAVPATVHNVYGFIQGADYAAKELEKADQIALRFAYNNFFCDQEAFQPQVEQWYEDGVELVYCVGTENFAIGAAKKCNGKIMATDWNHATVDFGNSFVGRSTKNYNASLKMMLQELLAGNWDRHAGKFETLGIISENPEENFVQQILPDDQWTESFTEEDYKAIVKAIANGKVHISNNTEELPQTTITIKSLGNFKEP